jgi:hypothetical protein
MHSSYQVTATFSPEHLLDSFWVALTTHLRHISPSTAVEETVDGVGGGLAGGGVVEFDVAGGVGGEGREEGVDIGTVDAIFSEGSVCTDVFEVILGSSVSDEVEKGKHGKERDGKREGIEGSHFDKSDSSSLQLCKIFGFC